MELLTEQDVLTLEKRPEPLPAGVLPAGVEYKGPHGDIIAFYMGTPAPRVLQCEEAAALGEVLSFKVQEQPDGGWALSLRGADMERFAVLPFAPGAAEALLARCGLLPLPGRAENAPEAAEAAE